jgi:signal transduction histidine kinase
LYRAFVTVAGGILASLALAGILAALVAEDVRRRRALELGLADEALNESERRGALAVEAAELGTFQWDLREERVSSSERCRELLNVPPSAGTLLEWPSETFFAAVPAEDRETVVAAARRASRTGGEFTTEFRALCEDGSLRWLRGRGRRAMLGGTNVLTGVVADMTAQKRAELERLRLLRRLSDAQEEVQSRIARELHDQVGQTVTGLSLGLKTLERALGDRDISSSKATAAGRADDPISTVLWLQGLTAEIGRDIHRAAADLRPTALDDLGLPGALRTLAADWSARTGIRVEVQLIGEAGRFSTQVETATYRIVQEALTNVVKHAAAATVSVVLERRGSELRILIEDDGLGFDCDDVPALDRGRPRLGLVGIRERLLHLGGALQVEATPGAGTTLFVTIPLSDADLSRGQA